MGSRMDGVCPAFQVSTGSSLLYGQVRISSGPASEHQWGRPTKVARELGSNRPRAYF